MPGSGRRRPAQVSDERSTAVREVLLHAQGNAVAQLHQRGMAALTVRPRPGCRPRDNDLLDHGRREYRRLRGRQLDDLRA